MKEKALKILDFLFVLTTIIMSLLFLTKTITINELWGESMDPTYREGAYVVAIRSLFGYKPKQGQVIITEKLI